MKELIFSKDKYKMNWLREDCEYAKIKCPGKLEYKVSSERDEDKIKTIIILLILMQTTRIGLCILC